MALAGILAGCAATRPPADSPASLTPAELQARFERAYAALAAERYHEASDLFEEILRAEPRDRRARLELAYLYLRLKRSGEAVKNLDAALDDDPENMRVRMDLGYARLGRGQLDAAANDFFIVSESSGELQGQARQELERLEVGKSTAAAAATEEALLDQGYDALRWGDEPLAREKFEAAINQDPTRAETYKQLGYMSLAEGDVAGAAQRFDGAHRLDPGDGTASLQLGYLYDSLHNRLKAEEAFRAARRSSDEKVRAEALEGLRAIEDSRKKDFLDVNASPYYTSRFGNRITYLDAQLGHKPERDSPVTLYLGARYTRDSRSHSGADPQIYSDNAFLAGAGVRYQPEGYTASVSAEVNAAFTVVDAAEHARRAADYRVWLADYHYWDGRFLGPLGLITLWQLEPPRSFSDLGLSAGYYSRYRDNGIGELRTREGFKLLENGTSLATAYVPFNLLKDTNRDFFNNLVEAGLGVDLQPSIKTNLRLRAELLHGVYFGLEGRDRNPYGPNYNDFRLILLYSARFTRHDDERRAPPVPSDRIGGGELLW